MLTDVPETLKLTVKQGKHVKHISSVPHRGHLSHPGPQAPRTKVYVKDVLDKQNQGICMRFAHDVWTVWRFAI